MDSIRPLGYKKCKICQGVFPATGEYFYINQRMRDGLYSCCKKCHLERKAKHREEHPERYQRQRRRYYLEHRDEIIDKACEYKKANPDKVSLDKKRYREKYRDRLRHRSRQYYLENRERILEKTRQYFSERGAVIRDRQKQHRKENPEYYRLATNKRRSIKLGHPNHFEQGDWNLCLEYWRGCCAVCGRPQGLWHTLAADHWIPLSYDGDDNPGTVPTNIVPLCHGVGGCNNSKGAKMPLDWLSETYGKRKAREIMRRVQEYFDWVTARGDEPAAD